MANKKFYYYFQQGAERLPDDTVRCHFCLNYFSEKFSEESYTEAFVCPPCKRERAKQGYPVD